MKLIILIITPNDSLKVSNYLRKMPVYFCKISSIGGIISSGSYTYLIKVNDELNSGDKVTYKVRVEFDKNIEITQLPKESEIIDLIFAINYVQK